MVTVPDLVNMTLADAEMTLFTYELGFPRQESEYSSTVPAGWIIRQEPEAGEVSEDELENGVLVVVSRGPEPTITVPNVVGMTLQEARNTLEFSPIEDIGLAQENSATVPMGCVIRQDPEPGQIPASEAEDGILLVISLGPDLSEGETFLLPGEVRLVMMQIPAGSFMMGHYPGEQDYFDDEIFQHEVTLTKDFWLGKHEVTQGQWQALMATAPWVGQVRVQEGPNYPAVYISWDDAQGFVAELSNYTGKTFRLPTEAEWEYACRAGTATRFYWGDDPNYEFVSDYACWTGNAWDIGEHYAHEVGLRQPNGWGLFDMSGNVFEWCSDWRAFYPPDPAIDPTGPTGELLYRVCRGGSWFSAARNCRSAARCSSYPEVGTPTVGLRVVRVDSP
jgi:formylglycine-generating enzyme required for sulfatase activity